MEIKKLPKSQLEIKSEIPWNDWKKYIDRAVEKLGKEFKMAGFRPGKIPRRLLEEKIGKEVVLEEAAGLAIEKDYPQIVSENKLDVIGQPRAEILRLSEDNDLEYKITTAVMPQVILSGYRESVSAVNQKHLGIKIEVKEAEIEEELRKLAESRVKMITVNRPAQKGDSVFLDFDVLQDNVPVENGSARNHPVILGRGVFIPGFEKNIIGMRENEQKEFNLVFPQKYHEKRLAGQTATFRAKVNLVQERQVPVVDDEFVRSLGRFESLDDLKKSLREGLSLEKERAQLEKKRAEIIDKLVEKTQADLPEVLIEGEIKKMLEEVSLQIQPLGISLEEYLSRLGKSKEVLEQEWKPQAIKRIKAALALEQIAHERELEVPAEKIEEEMNKILNRYRSVMQAKKNIELDKLYNYTKSVLLNEEVFKFLESL